MAHSNTSHTQWQRAAILLPALLMLAWATSCNDKESSKDNAPMIEGRIVSYNEFGAAMLSFTEDDMRKAGFSFGDVVTITVNGKDYLRSHQYSFGHHNRCLSQSFSCIRDF